MNASCGGGGAEWAYLSVLLAGDDLSFSLVRKLSRVFILGWYFGRVRGDSAHEEEEEEEEEDEEEEEKEEEGGGGKCTGYMKLHLTVHVDESTSKQ